MHKIFYKNSFFHRMLDRPWYGYNLYQAAILAKKLSIPKISVIEFGVAAGGGIINIEKHIKQISSFTGVDFEIYGFDTSYGLPELLDYRDLKHTWEPGMFQMDFENLQKKLAFSKLIIGRIEETLDTFFENHRPAPIGCIMFDLDLYSSTKAAFKIFNGDSSYFLPRIRCYFDDILGNETSLSNKFVGEALAIEEFNQEKEHIKITPLPHLLAKTFPYKWYHKCYATHLFTHPLYEKRVNNSRE